MQIEIPTANALELIKDAARQLTGFKRRMFQAQTTVELLGGIARRAESVFGWNRQTVTLGLHERRSRVHCLERFKERGRLSTEEKNPALVQEIHRLAEPHSQADPQLKHPFAYTRLTAKAIRQRLLDQGGDRKQPLPTLRTFSSLLNRLGYRLRSVQKCLPAKKIPQTDAIFANVRALNQAADASPETVRVSVDCKATVAVGDYSRDGQARGSEPVKALDHDMEIKTKLIPCGLLQTKAGELTVAFGQSAKTSDFVADVIADWAGRKQPSFPQVKELLINLDNGPESSGQRTQFLQRMVDLADATGWRIHLVYYPPYHSKYNPVERCWGVLERHWNGALLSNVPTALAWCSSMTWKGLKPLVWLCEEVYAKGVRLGREAKQALERRLTRSATLPKWDVLIEPKALVH
jgi:hypothetical protein